jgi:hypothetical protein
MGFNEKNSQIFYFYIKHIKDESIITLRGFD